MFVLHKAQALSILGRYNWNEMTLTCEWMLLPAAILKYQKLYMVRSPTLLSLLVTCPTNMGSRLLRHWLHHPLRDPITIQHRLGNVSTLIGETGSGPIL